MSEAKNRYQAERWLATAEEDLEAVGVLVTACRGWMEAQER
jgi:hypothetical protein